MAYVNVAGTLHSIASGNIIANTDELFDKNKNKKQSVINLELEANVLECVKTIVYDVEHDSLLFKDGQDNVIYSLDLSRISGSVKNIITDNGQIVVKYYNDRPDLVFDIFVKNDYYSKIQINSLQDGDWVMTDAQIDELLDYYGFTLV